MLSDKQRELNNLSVTSDEKTNSILQKGLIFLHFKSMLNVEVIDFFWATQIAVKLIIEGISPIRPTALQTDSCPAYENSSQNCNSIVKTVKKADDLLQVLGQLRKEMHDMLQVKFVLSE